MNESQPSSSQTTAAEVMPGRQPLGPTSLFLVLLTMVLWGGTPVAISYSVDTLPPSAVAAVRFLLAAGFMLVWCRIEGTGLRLGAGQVVPSLVTGLLLFVQIGLFTAGIQYSSSSHATLFINTFIFWVVAIEHFILRTDRLNVRKLAGLSIAAIGALSVLSDGAGSGDVGTTVQDAPTLAGDAMLLASGCLLGVKIIYTKHAVQIVEPAKLIFWHDVVGVALFCAYSAVFEETNIQQLTWPAFWGLLYQGVVVAGLCFAIQAQLLKRHPASQISVFSFATPLFGILFAVLFRGDRLSPWLFVSGVCVAAGILLVNWSPSGDKQD